MKKDQLIFRIARGNFYFIINAGAYPLGGQGGHAPQFSFQTKQGPQISFSSIWDIAFYQCSEITRSKNFTIFTVHATFKQFMVTFNFF